MMASHGRGQRVGRVGFRVLGCAALVGLGLGGVPGSAAACHIHHAHRTPATEAGATTTTPTVASAQLLTPTSLVPQAAPLTPATAPLPTVMPTATTAAPDPVMSPPAAILNPTPLTNPPAAEQVVPSAPPAVAVWHDNVPTAPASASAACSCTCPPLTTPPGMTNPAPAGQGLNPPGSTLPPSLGSSVTTPEPSTILSALVMVGAAVAYRRRGRVAG